MNKFFNILIVVSFCIFLTACGKNVEKTAAKLAGNGYDAEKTAAVLEAKGYDVEVSENGEIRIYDDGFSFYYSPQKNLSFNTGYDLDRVEADLEEKTPRTDTDHKPGKFVMYKAGDKEVDIYLTFNEYFNRSGYEENEYHVPLKGGFDEDDLWTTDLADFEREYYTLTTYYISSDELEAIYDKGTALLKE